MSKATSEVGLKTIQDFDELKANLVAVHLFSNANRAKLKGYFYETIKEKTQLRLRLKDGDEKPFLGETGEVFTVPGGNDGDAKYYSVLHRVEESGVSGISYFEVKSAKKPEELVLGADGKPVLLFAFDGLSPDADKISTVGNLMLNRATSYVSTLLKKQETIVQTFADDSLDLFKEKYRDQKVCTVFGSHSYGCRHAMQAAKHLQGKSGVDLRKILLAETYHAHANWRDMCKNMEPQKQNELFNKTVTINTRSDYTGFVSLVSGNPLGQTYYIKVPTVGPIETHRAGPMFHRLSTLMQNPEFTETLKLVKPLDKFGIKDCGEKATKHWKGKNDASADKYEPIVSRIS